MVERKTRTSKATSSETRAFVVVLEEIRAQKKGFGEALRGLREQVEAGFEAVDRRFDRDAAPVRKDGFVRLGGVTRLVVASAAARRLTPR